MNLGAAVPLLFCLATEPERDDRLLTENEVAPYGDLGRGVGCCFGL